MHFPECLEHGLGVSLDAIHFSDQHPAGLRNRVEQMLQCLSLADVQSKPS